jgi:hypothetical protein
MSKAHTEQLIKNYFELCFSAIDLNRNRFPFKQIFEAAIKRHDVLTISVHVQPNKKSEDVQRFIISFKDSQISIIANLPNSHMINNKTWIVDEQYLKTVLNNQSKYLQNPSYFDWGWIN